MDTDAQKFCSKPFLLGILTALVIAICFWAVGQIRQVSHRNELLDKIYAELGDPTVMLGSFPAEEKPIPFVWSLLGATPRRVLYVKHDRFDDVKLREIKSLFPESFILISTSRPNEWVPLTRSSTPSSGHPSHNLNCFKFFSSL